MDFSRFFIDRPIFAAVLSILIFITGLIAIPLLPVSEYPDVVPPSVQVRAEYPGANPKVIAETVATPLEEAINGVENMMYMKSVAGSDGVLVTTVTFRPGTDPDQAQVQVQNRVSQAEARLPEDVRRLGITTQKQSPTLTLVVHLFSPNGKYDSLYMRNYATLKVKDELARLPGVGQIQIFGAGEYAMRIWLDPNKVAARGLTASDVVTAMQEQNVQVSAGQLGAEPLPKESDFLISINAQGVCTRKKSSAISFSKRPRMVRWYACATWRASKWGRAATRCVPSLTIKMRSGSASSSRRGPTPLICRMRYAPKWTNCPRVSRKT
jgi:multidrug efflux pump